MGSKSQAQKRKEYYKIYQQIYKDPFMLIYEIAQNTRLSRNTVTKYIQEMYAQGVLRGPYIKMNPALNYREYMYLLNFSDPFKVYRGLKGFPHVLQVSITSGNWNTVVTTDRHINFSKLKGFQSVVYWGVKGLTCTPKVEYTGWDETFKIMYKQIKEFTPLQKEDKKQKFHPLNWKNKEWKLYHAFKSNLRQKVTPTLRKIKVQYDIYTKWMQTLKDHCTIHTEFYPEELKTYMGYCFLFSSDYKSAVQSLFSFLPTSSVITDIGNQVLVFTQLPFPDMTRRLICTIYDMQAVEMIRKFSQAIILSP